MKTFASFSLSLSVFILLSLLAGKVLAAPTNQASAEQTDSQARGEYLYKKICTVCHDSGVPKAPTRGMLEFMSTSAIYQALVDGVMASRVPQLSRQDKQDVAEYLTGMPLVDEFVEAFPVCTDQASAFDYDKPPSVTGWGVSADNRREFSDELAGINKKNIGNLKLKWAFGFPNAVRARSHPVVGAGAVHVGSQDGRVYSLDMKTGCVRWIFRARAEVRTAIIMSPWKAGDSKARPKLYFGDYLGNVYAINALTGESIWQARPDQHPNATLTGSPTLYKNRLYVPVSSLEVLSAVDDHYPCCNFRGSVVAYEADSGEQLWKTYTIVQKPVVSGVNKAGVEIYGASGAPVWNSPAIDTQRNQLLVGTGENYSQPVSDMSDSIIAMNLDDGKVNWHFQATKGDAWNAACESGNGANCPSKVGPDYDFGSPPMLVNASNGKSYVLAGQKSGMVWALNPDNGKLIWKKQVSKGGLNGGIHFGMAASGDSLFVPISDDMTSKYHAPRTPNPGVFSLDITSGDYQWKWHAVNDVCDGKAYCKPGNGAAITTTQQMVFAGSLDGYIRAHDIHTGTVVWQFDTARTFETVNGITGKGGAMEGSASAVLQDGMMFLNSGYFFNPYMPGNLFMAFGLDIPEENL